jgi:hypothetical protein
MFDAWVKTAGDSGALHGEVSEHFDEADGAPEHDFVIFSTNRELVWPDSDMGFAPNVAGSSIHSSADTVQKPEVPSGLDELENLGKRLSSVVGTTIAIAAGALVFVGGIALLARRRR